MDGQILIAMIGIATSLIMIAITIASVLLARRAFLADHERRKKQATIEWLAMQRHSHYVPLSEKNLKA